ncbi:lipopolysaccharide assembly protein LapA domain-containing protein [Arenibaculum sp.]|uniref:lipopolysaccharide assembly protein LapA domain-containing protein n=1 Tax=Arenibaculum sp. TaxID=2865862 RepID=UPI002E1653B9|nr:lipopolysaccharide assembly protein LapA domain-containing protein [Arenibaculum sp.]
MRHLSWVITIPLALLVISFAVSNRDEVSLGLWPLPGRMEVPLFLVGLLGLLIGFLAGGIVAWVAGRRHRVAARREARRAARLSQELDDERRRHATAEAKLAEAAREVSAAASALPVGPSAKTRLELAGPKQ